MFSHLKTIVKFPLYSSIAICLWLLATSAACAGDRLLATGGVSQIEGAAGGGLVPWAVITGYGTRDQIGLTAFHTAIEINDFRLMSSGVAVGLYDRLEISLARQMLSLQKTAPGQSIRQDIFGAKLNLVGDAVVDQDRWLPQISIGLQHKKNRDMRIPADLGARRDNGNDYYISATKLYLAGFAGRNLLLSATLRATKANQMGLLGFGGDKRDRYQTVLETSAAIFLTDNFVVGAEYRVKPDNLSVFREDNSADLFAAWFVSKRVSATLAYARLGQLADKPRQNGVYLSLQLSH